jgi:hypothetical protein
MVGRETASGAEPRPEPTSVAFVVQSWNRILRATRKNAFEAAGQQFAALLARDGARDSINSIDAPSKRSSVAPAARSSNEGIPTAWVVKHEWRDRCRSCAPVRVRVGDPTAHRARQAPDLSSALRASTRCAGSQGSPTPRIGSCSRPGTGKGACEPRARHQSSNDPFFPGLGVRGRPSARSSSDQMESISLPMLSCSASDANR